LVSDFDIRIYQREVPLPPFEHLLDAFLRVILPPALLAAVLVALPALFAWRYARRDVLTQLGAALGVAAGLALGLSWNDRALVTSMPEGEGWRWLPLTTVAALIVTAIAYLPWVGAGVGWGLRGAIAANAGWLLTPAELRGEYLWAPVALGGVILAEWAVLEALAGKGRVALLGALAAVAASVVLIYAASLRFNELALTLAGSLAGIGIVAAALRAQASAAAAGAVVVLPALLLAGWYESESEVPIAGFVLVALAPLALAPALLPVWQRYRDKSVWVLVQFVLLLLPLAAAIGLVAAKLGPLEYE
jgi:hypothetical protein